MVKLHVTLKPRNNNFEVIVSRPISQLYTSRNGSPVHITKMVPVPNTYITNNRKLIFTGKINYTINTFRKTNDKDTPMYICELPVDRVMNALRSHLSSMNQKNIIV
jgi:hypothetical protein